MLNRCAHRGVQFCRTNWGNTRSFTCPYHQWSYDLKGNLTGCRFAAASTAMAGCPRISTRRKHGLTRLSIATRHGVIFASFDSAVPPLEEYLGPAMLPYFDRVFDGRELRVLGYSRQRIPANWKLMFENIKDPYHASLLHVFLVTFGLFRADQPSAVKMDSSGMHCVLTSSKGEQKINATTKEMKNFRADFKLSDPRLLDPVREFPGAATVVMQTLWPNIIIQQQSNTLAMRHLVPRGPEVFDLMWTFFGYADDTPEMTQRRLRQANLMGPAGLVSIDDGEVMEFSQQGVRAASRRRGRARDGRARHGRQGPHGDRGGDPRLLQALPRGDGVLSTMARAQQDFACGSKSRSCTPSTLTCWTISSWSSGRSFSPTIVFIRSSRARIVNARLPLALMRCESKAMLTDRVVTIRQTQMFAPRALRHLVSSLQIAPATADGVDVQANYAVLQTLVDDETRDPERRALHR